MPVSSFRCRPTGCCGTSSDNSRRWSAETTVSSIPWAAATGRDSGRMPPNMRTGEVIPACRSSRPSARVRDAKTRQPSALQRAGHLDRAVAIGVRLHHR